MKFFSRLYPSRPYTNFIGGIMRTIQRIALAAVMVLGIAVTPLLAHHTEETTNAHSCDMAKACCTKDAECCKTGDADCCKKAEGCCSDKECCKTAADGTHTCAMKHADGEKCGATCCKEGHAGHAKKS